MNLRTDLLLRMARGGGVAAVVPPTPPPIPTDVYLELWLKADAGLFQLSGGTVPATASGDVIGYWKDYSGHNNNAVQATTAKKASVAAGAINGLPVVRFASAGSAVLTISAIALSGAYTVYTVVRLPAGVLIPVASMTTNAEMEFSAGSQIYIIDDVLTFYNAGASFGVGNVGILRVRRAGAANGILVRTTGSVEQGPGTVIATSTLTAVGGSPGRGRYSDGDIAEIIVYSRFLSAAEQTQVENYLTAKWAVTF